MAGKKLCMIHGDDCIGISGDCFKPMTVGHVNYYCCSEMARYIIDFHPLDDIALCAMAYEIGVTFTKMKKTAVNTIKADTWQFPGIIVERN